MNREQAKQLWLRDYDTYVSCLECRVPGIEAVYVGRMCAVKACHLEITEILQKFFADQLYDGVVDSHINILSRHYGVTVRFRVASIPYNFNLLGDVPYRGVD